MQPKLKMFDSGLNLFPNSCYCWAMAFYLKQILKKEKEKHIQPSSCWDNCVILPYFFETVNLPHAAVITTPLLIHPLHPEMVQYSDGLLPLGMPCVFVTKDGDSVYWTAAMKMSLKLFCCGTIVHLKKDKKLYIKTCALIIKISIIL